MRNTLKDKQVDKYAHQRASDFQNTKEERNVKGSQKTSTQKKNETEKTQSTFGTERQIESTDWLKKERQIISIFQNDQLGKGTPKMNSQERGPH